MAVMVLLGCTQKGITRSANEFSAPTSAETCNALDLEDCAEDATCIVATGGDGPHCRAAQNACEFGLAQWALLPSDCQSRECAWNPGTCRCACPPDSDAIYCPCECEGAPPSCDPPLSREELQELAQSAAPEFQECFEDAIASVALPPALRVRVQIVLRSGSVRSTELLSIEGEPGPLPEREQGALIGCIRARIRQLSTRPVHEDTLFELPIHLVPNPRSFPRAPPG